MLVLTRKQNQAIRIGPYRVVVVEVRRGAVRLGVEAPREVTVVREELTETEREEAVGGF